MHFASVIRRPAAWAGAANTKPPKAAATAAAARRGIAPDPSDERSGLRRHVTDGRVDTRAFLLDRLDVEASPRCALVAHAEDDHARHVESLAVRLSPLPAPL